MGTFLKKIQLYKTSIMSFLWSTGDNSPDLETFSKVQESPTTPENSEKDFKDKKISLKETEPKRGAKRPIGNVQVFVNLIFIL